jgi:tRNA threonylcarbamoyladenosine biosynthesis protein TsaB
MATLTAMTRLLAIDCSTERLVLGLGDGARTWTRDEEGGARASSRLLPLLHELLAQAGLTLHALDAIAFAAGPGAFTGLRTACAAAQGLALGADNKPVLALDSLAVVAEDARAQGAPVHALGWVAMDARMDEAYAAAYRWQDGRWRGEQAAALWSPEALAARWAAEPPAWVAGSALGAFGDARLATVGGATLRLPHMQDRAAALLALARQAWDGGEALDAAQAQPRYVRDKVALTSAERAARTAA